MASASVGYAPSSGVNQPAESSCGHLPVNIEACDGSVQEDVDFARSKRIPRAASSSSVGLVGRE